MKILMEKARKTARWQGDVRDFSAMLWGMVPCA